MAVLYPWQLNERAWCTDSYASVEQVLEALQKASYTRPRWENNANWSRDGLRFEFRWTTTRRFPGQRTAWSDGSFGNSLRAAWNEVVLNVREGEALKRGQHYFRKITLPHAFDLNILLEVDSHNKVNARFTLVEEIDPDQTSGNFEHGAESVASRIDEVMAEFQSALGSSWHEAVAEDQGEPRGDGRVRRLSPANPSTLLSETVDRCLTDGLLPSFQRSGKFNRPRHRSPILDAETWELAHYAHRCGPLYHDESSWRLARDLVESFMPRGISKGRFIVDLPNAFGVLKGVKAGWLSKNLQLLFEQCGFTSGPAGSGGLDFAFRARSSTGISELPEPYGKWLQLRERAPRWRDKAELEVSVEATVKPDPKTGEACLSLRTSTLVPSLLDRLALALNRQFQLALDSPALALPTPFASRASHLGTSVRRLPPQPGKPPAQRRTAAAKHSWKF